ncbi:MAG: hypothetical protein ACP5NV_02460 [Candidatus Woesearchaeota archaeon]
MEYILLEYIKQEDNHAVLAVPSELFKRSTNIGELVNIEHTLGEDMLIIRGNLKDVTKSDFSHDTFFYKGVAPLIPLLDLENNSNKENILADFEKLSDKYNIDKNTNNYTSLQNQLLTQILFSGDIYAVRAKNKNETRTAFAFVDKNGILSLENNNLIYNGNAIQNFDDSNAGSLMRKNGAEIIIVGSGTFTGKTLNKFYSRGQMGGVHVNDRTIRPIDKKSIEKIDFLNE